MSLKKIKILCFIAPIIFLSACGKTEQTPEPKGIEVSVVEALPQTIQVTNKLPGRLEAVRVAEVRARVSGILEKRLFTEGSDVEAKQQLFQIDNRQYAALLSSAKAHLAQAKARLYKTSILAKRLAPLVKDHAVSKQQYDDAVADEKTAQADVTAAQADIVSANLKMEYAAVTSPISGRIGRALVTEGALVGEGTPTPMALVQQIDPIYVNFTQPAKQAMNLRRGLLEGVLNHAQDGNVVTVYAEDGKQFEYKGKLLFSDITVDPSSGQLELRALIPNPDKLLLPGMYVRVKLEQAAIHDAYLIPLQAVHRSEGKDYVFVVDKDNSVHVRTVSIAMAQGQNWVIQSGLKKGEKVIVEGEQRLPADYEQQKIKVNPILWEHENAQQVPSVQTKTLDKTKPTS